MLKKLSNLSLFLFLIPGISMAAERITENQKDKDIVGFLTRIKNYLLGFVGALAVLFIIWGGLQYITSGGNPKRIETAKKTLTYAIIGLIFVLLSNVILAILSGDFLPSILGGDTKTF